MRQVIDASRPLSDKSLMRLKKCFDVLHNEQPVSTNAVQCYEELRSKIKQSVGDYDAVEVLNLENEKNSFQAVKKK